MSGRDEVKMSDQEITEFLADNIKVQVASLPPADSGRGFARLPDGLMDELGLAEGDVIEIVGKR